MISFLSCLRVRFWLGAWLISGASSIMAGSVLTNDVPPLTKCTSYTSMAVNPAGDVVINGCNSGNVAPTSATFAVTAASTAVTTGTPLAVTVTRNIASGVTAGNDTLTLTSSVAGTFTPPTVSFTATELVTSSQTSSITFSAAGTATLSATGVTTVTSSNPITVTAPSPGGCTNTITSKDLGAMPSGGGVKYDITEPMALRFHISPADPVGQTYTVLYEDSVPSTLHNALDTTISTCSGDFTASGMPGTQALCKVVGSPGGGPIMSVKDSTHCRIEPNVDYYINIRPSTGVKESAFLLIIS